MSEKELAISETIRLIKTNHEVDDNIEQVLSEIYDLGYHIGTLTVKCGLNFREHPDVKKFNIERDVDERALEVHPLRIANNRNLTYNGPEITTSHVLAYDVKYNTALQHMKCKDVQYKYFDADTGDIEWHKKRLDNSYDEEEKEYEYSNYNELEVKILFQKLYQVAMSIACDETYEMPNPVNKFFSYKKMMNDMDSKGMDVEYMKNHIVKYEKEVSTNYPDYKDWEQYYFG